ncbi:YfhO family protein, partial [bacterium]|nr:YfhO family protein [bacterium]
DYTDLVEKGRENLSLISLLNVRHLISREKIPDLKLVHDEKGVKVYENRKALPRAFFVPEARIIKDREKILEVMLSKDFDPAREVLLEEEVHSPRSTVYSLRSAFRIPHSAFRILEYQPNRVTIQDFVAPSDGFLFLSDTYYPGWRAYVDGVQTKIYRANYTFRAIQIKEGRHRIEFIYRPLSFIIGSLGSIITLLVLTGYGIWKKYLDGIKKIKYNRESFKIKWR